MRFTFLITGLVLVGGTAQAADGAAGSLPLTQAQAQALALERNHDLAIARSTVAAAQANVLSAGAAPNPVLGVSTASIDLTGHSGGGSMLRKQVDTIVSLSQLIERGDKRELRRENAQHNVRAADADLHEVRRQLRLLVAHAYADLHAAQDKLAATRDAAQLLDAMLAAAQTRRKSGDIAGADVERVRVDVLRAKNDAIAADADLQRTRRSLALLLGESARADLIEAADPWPAPDDAAPLSGTSIADIADRRSDVIAALARIDAAGAGIRLAESLRTRDLSVGVQFEHFPQPGSASPAGNSVGVSLQVPLFTRYYYEGEIGASLAALETAREAHRRARAVAETDIGNALAALRSAGERVRRNRDELLVAAEKASTAAEYAYRNGAVGVIDMLDARRTLRATRLDALTALADFSKALASWRAATETTDPSRP